MAGGSDPAGAARFDLAGEEGGRVERVYGCGGVRELDRGWAGEVLRVAVVVYGVASWILWDLTKESN